MIPQLMELISLIKIFIPFDLVNSDELQLRSEDANKTFE